MKDNKKTNAEQTWKQLEDLAVPRLRLSIVDRAVYSHLLRHSRLEGRLRISFSIAWLARGTRLSDTPTRQALRRLLAHGALRLVQRSKAGHVIEVRLPEEIPALSDRALRAAGVNFAAVGPVTSIEQADFMQSKSLRQSIHARERGLCFYCLRRLTGRVQCLDHVIPQVQFGRNSYRNLVSCCLECNSHKGQRPAEDFLRSLYRDRSLTAIELAARLRALDALASGKLLPLLSSSANPLPRKGRPPLSPAA